MVPNKFQPRRGQPGITVDPRGRQVWQMKENGPCSWTIAGTRFRQACGVGAQDMCISQFNFRSSSGTRPTYFRSKLEQARTWICFFRVHVQDSVVAQFGLNYYWSAAFKPEIRSCFFVTFQIVLI